MPSLAWRWLCAIFLPDVRLINEGLWFLSHPSLFLPLFFTFSSCLQRRGGRRIHWKTTQLENGGVFWLKDLLLTQDDDVIWAVHPCAAEQHWLWAALLWLTKDDPVGGARVPPTGSASQHSQEVIKMQTWRTQFGTLTQRSPLCFLAIAEVGGVPFEILEPVLERCTPEQLYRIEQSNQVSREVHVIM